MYIIFLLSNIVCLICINSHILVIPFHTQRFTNLHGYSILCLLQYIPTKILHYKGAHL